MQERELVEIIFKTSGLRERLRLVRFFSLDSCLRVIPLILFCFKLTSVESGALAESAYSVIVELILLQLDSFKIAKSFQRFRSVAAEAVR